MHLQEALKTISDSRLKPPEALKVHLACGFTPVHLITFLSAHLTSASAGRPVDCVTSEYGNLVNALRRIDPDTVDAVAVVVQWNDLDPRLGLRRTGGWQPAIMDDICRNAPQRLKEIQESVRLISQRTKTVLALPGLNLPPAFSTPTWRLSTFEASLRQAVMTFARECSELPMVGVLNEQWLDAALPRSERHDVRGEITQDSPLRLAYASALGKGLATLIAPPAPLKGIITDLDDTLWRGIIGDSGVDGVAWDPDSGSHNHALYQQLLESLAASGVLLAVATKNDPELAAAGLKRSDLLIPGTRFYPVEANWSAKSNMVRRILATWNVGEDAVVFIDDNPMEIAQIQSEFPSMKCLLFPARDYDKSVKLLSEIRDLFGKHEITAEDLLRSESIRRAASASAEGDSGETNTDAFLAQMEATVDIQFGSDATDPRPLQLINKTNQFNMNGLRVSGSAWSKLLRDPNAIILVASYADKYGPLGKVSVAVGNVEGETLNLQHWVLSCRAFARRIEYRILEVLFRTLNLNSIQFSYSENDRNKPFSQFLSGLTGGPVSGSVTITRQTFDAVCRTLYERCNVNGYANDGSVETVFSQCVSGNQAG